LWKDEWDDAFVSEYDDKIREKYLAMVIEFLGDLERNDTLQKKSD